MKTKHFLALTYGAFFMILSFAAFAYALESGSSGDSGVVARGEIPAADQPPPKTYATETQEQRLERMLRAFDHGNYQEGVIDVSFAEEITKEQAIEIIQKNGANIISSRLCSTPEISNPGDRAKYRGVQECTDDGWNDRLKLARVQVPKGQEKYYAQQMIRSEGVRWIEPEPINKAGSGIPATMEQPPGVQEPGAPTSKQRFVVTPRSNNAYYISGAILIILFVAYLLRRKKR